MEELLRKIPGVLETEVGYTGGTLAEPDLRGRARPARPATPRRCEIVFDPTKLSLRGAARDWFFRMHDPTTRNRQGNDVGTQYRSAIFVPRRRAARRSPRR